MLMGSEQTCYLPWWETWSLFHTTLFYRQRHEMPARKPSLDMGSQTWNSGTMSQVKFFSELPQSVLLCY
jgi:hypothetical protein